MASVLLSLMSGLFSLIKNFRVSGKDGRYQELLHLLKLIKH
jgi:hypothetical protein